MPMSSHFKPGIKNPSADFCIASGNSFWNQSYSAYKASAVDILHLSILSDLSPYVSPVTSFPHKYNRIYPDTSHQPFNVFFEKIKFIRMIFSVYPPRSFCKFFFIRLAFDLFCLNGSCCCRIYGFFLFTNSKS